jgi:hypothetical protein
VIVLDTGLAAKPWCPDFAPCATPTVAGSDPHDEPDENNDQLVDPVAGHGTFIAGLVERLAPGASVEIVRVLSTFGIGDDFTIASVIASLDHRSS